MSAFAYKLTFDLSEICARDGLKSARSGRHQIGLLQAQDDALGVRHVGGVGKPIATRQDRRATSRETK